jgi:hypothetical protein
MTAPNTPADQGDPFGGEKSEPKNPGEVSARVINAMHRRSDVDAKATAQHHTLGVQRNQASPGDHVHDGKAGAGLNLAVSGSRGGNAAVASILTMLKNVISFTDNTTP